MTSQKGIWVALIAVAIIALAGLVYPTAVQLVGGAINYDEVDATAIKIGGTNGSRVGPIISSTCNLLNADTSVTATSSIPVDCAVTGVVSGDVVFMQLSTTTTGNQLVANWAIVAARASSTAGFITGRLVNFTGGTAVPSATAVGSSTEYLVIHPVTSVPGL